MAISRPGSLDDDGDEAAATTTTEQPAETTAPPTTPAPDAGATTTPGSGLGAEGSGTVRQPGEPIADTGGEAMIGLGLVLLASGLAARRTVGATRRVLRDEELQQHR